MAVAAGESHSVALKANGELVVWGSDYYNQLDIPPGLFGVVGIAAGSWHTVALKGDGTVAAFGASWGE